MSSPDEASVVVAWLFLALGVIYEGESLLSSLLLGFILLLELFGWVPLQSATSISFVSLDRQNSSTCMDSVTFYFVILHVIFYFAVANSIILILGSYCIAYHRAIRLGCYRSMSPYSMCSDRCCKEGAGGCLYVARLLL